MGPSNAARVDCLFFREAHMGNTRSLRASERAFEPLARVDRPPQVAPAQRVAPRAGLALRNLASQPSSPLAEPARWDGQLDPQPELIGARSDWPKSGRRGAAHTHTRLIAG